MILRAHSADSRLQCRSFCLYVDEMQHPECPDLNMSVGTSGMAALNSIFANIDYVRQLVTN